MSHNPHPSNNLRRRLLLRCRCCYRQDAHSSSSCLRHFQFVSRLRGRRIALGWNKYFRIDCWSMYPRSTGRSHFVSECSCRFCEWGLTTLPQRPQLLGSLVRSEQLLPQIVCVEVGHTPGTRNGQTSQQPSKGYRRLLLV